MKKLFVSCPMKGRTEENIKKSIETLHKVAELHFGEELELIDSYIDIVPETKDEGIWCLGKSIQMMAEADYFVAPRLYVFEERYVGVSIEEEVANGYGIPCMFVDPTAECFKDIAKTC